ncbi:MAG: hypothetical protein GY870_11820 [archaeon]|nr:hypothetical protein [archaeon]
MEKTKKKRNKGFASIVEKQLGVLNTLDSFKAEYKDMKKTFLLNAIDGKYAAIVKIKEGILTVDGISNKPNTVLKKMYNELGWNARLDTKAEIFLNMLTGKLSIFGMAIKFCTGKIRVRGLYSLFQFYLILKMLQTEQKNN